MQLTAETTTDELFLRRLMSRNGYRDAKVLRDDQHARLYAAISPFAYTYGVIVGELGDDDMYLDRWCYHSYAAAKAALDAWDGHGEPTGWHRHPRTGRRVSESPDEFDQDGKRVGEIGALYVRY
jgi:hypothetical protein